MLTRHGGTVEKFVGDAVMAVFGVPVAHEDDALRACRAATEMFGSGGRARPAASRRCTASASEVRIGVETGEVVVGDPARGSTFVSGAAVNTAARLEQAAQRRGVPDRAGLLPRWSGTVWWSRSDPALRLRGVDARYAYRLLDVRDLATRRRAARQPLVGRTRELALLRRRSTARPLTGPASS